MMNQGTLAKVCKTNIRRTNNPHKNWNCCTLKLNCTGKDDYNTTSTFWDPSHAHQSNPAPAHMIQPNKIKHWAKGHTNKDNHKQNRKSPPSDSYLHNHHPLAPQVVQTHTTRKNQLLQPRINTGPLIQRKTGLSPTEKSTRVKVPMQISHHDPMNQCDREWETDLPK